MVRAGVRNSKMDQVWNGPFIFFGIGRNEDVIEIVKEHGNKEK